MTREWVHAQKREIPASGPPDREPAHAPMVLWREEDPTRPHGFRLYVDNVQPDVMIAYDMIPNIIDAQDRCRDLGVEPLFEIGFNGPGHMETLTIRAENGTWIWRFVDYADQVQGFRLTWPD